MANRYNNSYWSDPNGQYHQGDAPFQFPWWAVVAGFVTFTPLGFVMLGVNLVLANTSAGKNTRAARPVSRQAAVNDGRGLARTLLILGIILALVGVAATSEALDMMLWSAFNGGGALYWLEDVISGMVPLGAGIGCLFGSWFTRTNGRMRQKIANIVGNADHMYIKDIAAAVPCDVNKCCRHLERCIDKGVFGPGAYLDMRTRCLVVRGPAPQPQPKPAKPKPKKAEPAPKKDPYAEILAELRSVNDAIPGKEMSGKITRLETVTARIFQQVAANPEKMPQMRKFMDYYLPTALKLLKHYAELDAQGVEGENIRLAKQRIEQTMDTLVVAFENQLDQLFSADAMDVSADIEVMENMLRADGLTGTQSTPAAPQPHLDL